MKILNIRLGLATNSSSTHSIVLLPKGKHVSNNDEDSPNFGWQFFTLSSPESKRDYLVATLFSEISHALGDDVAIAVANDWCEANIRPKDGDSLPNVDHQSALTLPKTWDGKAINKQFFDEFKEFLMRDDIVIAGGNDNADEKHHVFDSVIGGKAVLGQLPVENPWEEPWVARKDGDYWTIFNRNSGAKIRLTFKGDDFEKMPDRSNSPELVDVKITDHCPFGCAFCYQNSTPEGQHADAVWLQRLAYAMGDAEVFEVAIGGGEPTLHPKFIEILWNFRHYKVVPNFTTKNLAWLNNDEQRRAIMRLAGAWAYSAETANDVNNLGKAIEKAKKKDVPDSDFAYGEPSIKYAKVTVQHVVGVVEEAEFRKVLMACVKHRLPITLLGYKQVGRGPQFGVKPSAKWLKIVAEVCKLHSLKVGIDTALADTHWDALIGEGISPWMLTRVEGQFSCYVDAVQKTMNTSSYTSNTDVIKLDKDGYGIDIIKAYGALPK